MYTIAPKTPENINKPAQDHSPVAQTGKAPFSKPSPDANKAGYLQQLADNSGIVQRAAKWQQMAGNRKQPAPSTAVVQGVFEKGSDHENELLKIVEDHTSQKEMFEQIAKDDSFVVFIIEGALPASSGVTTVTLMDSKNSVIRNINSGEALKAVKKNELFQVAKADVGITISTTEHGFVNGQQRNTDNNAQAVAVLHEFERHVYPFYQLYKVLAMAEFNRDVLSTTGALDHAANAIQSGSYDAETQHQDPSLSGNTVLAVLQLAAQNNDIATRSKLLYRACMDTVARGVSLSGIQAAIPAQFKQQPVWLEFEEMAAFIEGAEVKQQKQDFETGERVLIRDQVYMGRFGVIDASSFYNNSPYPSFDTDLVVKIGSGLVAVSPAYCYATIQ